MSTMTELLVKYNEMATAAGKPVRKGFDNKAKAEAAIASLTPAKTKRTRKSGAAVKILAAQVSKTAGPRGYKFGPVWTKAVASASGIALRESNFAKLIAHATMLGVSVPAEASQEEVAKKVSAALA